MEHGNLHLLMRSNITYEGQVVRQAENVIIGPIWKIEVKLEPNLVYGYN